MLTGRNIRPSYDNDRGFLIISIGEEALMRSLYCNSVTRFQPQGIFKALKFYSFTRTIKLQAMLEDSSDSVFRTAILSIAL